MPTRKPSRHLEASSRSGGFEYACRQAPRTWSDLKSGRNPASPPTLAWPRYSRRCSVDSSCGTTAGRLSIAGGPQDERFRELLDGVKSCSRWEVSERARTCFSCCRRQTAHLGGLAARPQDANDPTRSWIPIAFHRSLTEGAQTRALDARAPGPCAAAEGLCRSHCHSVCERPRAHGSATARRPSSRYPEYG